MTYPPQRTECIASWSKIVRELITEEMAADVCDGIGLGNLLDHPWTWVPVRPPDVEEMRIACRCQRPNNPRCENCGHFHAPSGAVALHRTVVVKPVATMEVLLNEHTRKYYLRVGQCIRCLRVFWTASRNHPLLGEPTE